MTTKTPRHAARLPQPKRRTVLAMALAGAAAQLPLGARAQAFPSRSIRLVVPYSVGGPADNLGRVIAEKLSTKWRQPVVVENRPGANTLIGMGAVANSAPDGYSLVMATTAMAINDAIVDKLPYDSAKDFTPIVNLVASSSMLAVHPSVGARTLGELIAAAKAKPGKLTYGSGGQGSPTHAAAAMLETMAGISLVHVPYKGIAPAINDLLAGHISMVFADPSVLLPHVKDGKLHAIGVTSVNRYAAAPDVPTLAQAGLPGYESTLWYGLLGPAGMPRPVVSALNAAVVEALRAPDVQDKLAAYGITVIGDTPEHFAAFIESEKAKWKKSAIGMRVTADTARR